MKMIRHGANMRELIADDKRILISYSTPVAVIFDRGQTFISNKKWSSTTSRHITKWCGWNHETISQDELNEMAIAAGFNECIGAWKVLDSQKYGIREFNTAKGAK